MRRRHPASGFSLIEVLVGIGVLGLVMGVAYGSLIAQIRRHAGQMITAETLHAGRSAFDVMTSEIANAGFGIPSATSPSTAAQLVLAEPTRLRFWVAPATAHTYLTAAATLGSRTISVLSNSGLKAGTTVYLTDASRWHLGTVQSVSQTSVQLAAALSYNFAAGTFLTPVELVTYELTEGSLTRNGHVVIPNVTALQFTYDSKALEAIHVVTVRLSVQGRASEIAGGTRRVVTLGARVTPANLLL